MSIRTSARVLAAASLVAIVGGVTACATGGAGSTSLTSSDQRSLEATAGEAEVVAVMMTADWCPPCRTLKPNVQQAMTDVGIVGAGAFGFGVDRQNAFGNLGDQGFHYRCAGGVAHLLAQHAQLGVELVVDAGRRMAHANDAVAQLFNQLLLATFRGLSLRRSRGTAG